MTPARCLLLVVVSLLVLAPVVSYAQPVDGLVNNSIPDTIFADRSLEVRTGSPTDYAFSNSTAVENLTLYVANPSDETMNVYLALRRHGDWSIVGKLGTIPPQRNASISYPVNFTYNGRSVDRDVLGVLGKAGDTYTGNMIVVTERWGGYEDRLKSALAIPGLLVAAAMMLILLIIALGVASVEKRRQPAAAADESRLAIASFAASVRAAAGRITYIITTPYIWLFELACGAALTFLILFTVLKNTSLEIGILVFLVGGATAIFMPAIYLVVAWRIFAYRGEPFRYVVSMFMWGIMATPIAFLLNTTSVMVIGSLTGKIVALALTAIITAPIIEELAKGTGLLAISGRGHFNGPLAGLIFGFSIGTGFATVENWLYFAVNANPVTMGGIAEWAAGMAYRSLIDSLGHGCLTGTTGLIMGYVVSKTRSKAYALPGFILGLPFAMAMHALMNLFDLISPQAAFGIPLPVFDPVLTLLVAGVYTLIGLYLRHIESRKAKAGT